MNSEKTVRRRYRKLHGTMDERMPRRWARAEAEVIGYGGLATVARATRLAISTKQKGRIELRDGARTTNLVDVRRRGGGRPAHDVAHPQLVPALKKLVDPTTRGDPMSPVR